MTHELRRRNLIKTDTRDSEEVLTIHRKLQSKILQDLNKNSAQRDRAFTQAFLLVRTRFPTASPIQVPEPEKWPICRKYLLHVLSMRKLFNNKAIGIAPSLDLAQLFSDGGIDLWERGLTQEGLELLYTAEDILNEINSSDDNLRANIHVIISLLIQDSGLLSINESKRRCLEALDIRRKYCETQTPELYTRNDEILLHNSISDYGCVLLQYNEYQEAEPLFAECFLKYQSWDEPEEIPYEYAKYFHHMAFCQMYRGNLEEAIKLGKQGLLWVAAATGRDSAATNRWKFDLACLTMQSGDEDEAMKLNEEILGSRIKIHGKHAALTLQSQYALGACSAFRGDYPVAEYVSIHSHNPSPIKPLTRINLDTSSAQS
jgi:tetratricopeptide (TPR) repeat protein